MSNRPSIPCSICGGIYYGAHACGGSQGFSNLPDKWTVTDVAAQRREIAQLKGERDVLLARVAELSSLLAEARQDSERLDFLEAQQVVCLPMAIPKRWMVGQMGREGCGSGVTLREAIDAARGGPDGGTK